MKCTYCGHYYTYVIDSRLTKKGKEVRRRRECDKCRKRFTTYESAKGDMEC